MANVGTLVGTQNVTRGNFNTLPSSAKPAQLFSHSDQQVQWQSSLSDRAFTSGGGRMADLLAGVNEGDLSFSVSIAGVNSFQVGGRREALLHELFRFGVGFERQLFPAVRRALVTAARCAMPLCSPTTPTRSRCPLANTIRWRRWGLAAIPWPRPTTTTTRPATACGLWSRCWP